jgi:hypothetical protein
MRFITKKKLVVFNAFEESWCHLFDEVLGVEIFLLKLTSNKSY